MKTRISIRNGIMVVVLSILSISLLSKDVEGYVPTPKPNKFVGILYTTDSDLKSTNTSYVHPNLVPDNVGSWLWWGVPALGFYQSSNTNVINTHANQITSAGIDFILVDYSNNNIQTPIYHNPTLVLLAQYANRINRGVATPKIAFLSSTLGNDLERLYNEIYASYGSNLFFYLGSKPLLLTYPNNGSNPGCNALINGQPATNFFECRATNGFVGSGTWSFMENYSQGFYTRAEWPEEMSVSAAQQNYWMSYPGSRGRKWDYRTGLNNGPEGQNFDDQWHRAQEINPTFIIVKAWNEWAADRLDQCLSPFGAECDIFCSVCSHQQYTDQFSPEFSNDIEPVVGFHTNWYLNRIVGHISTYKRNSPTLYFYSVNERKWYFKEGRGGAQFGSNNFTHTFNWPDSGTNYQPFTGDFNGDILADIGLRDVNTGVWRFSLNQGNGNYATDAMSFNWGATGSHYQPIVGDFNADSRTDIGMRDPNNGIWYFAYQQPDGSFIQNGSFSWTSGSNYQAVVGRFSNTGWIDLGLRNTTTGVWSFAIRQANGTYVPTGTFSWAPGTNYQPFAGDFDCDSWGDIGLRDANIGVNYIANYNGVTYGNDFNNNYKWRSGTQYKVLVDPSQCSPVLP